MTFQKGLDIIIVLCALGVLASATRLPPESRGKVLLLGLAFLLMGTADFLKPISVPLAMGVEVLSYVLLIGIGARQLLAGDAPKPGTTAPSDTPPRA